MKKISKFAVFMTVVMFAPIFGQVMPAQAVTLYAPSLNAPANDQVLTNFPREASFNWSAVSGATRYELEIACDVCVSKTNKWTNAKTYSASGTSYTTKVPGADNQFRWRVRAYNGSTAGNWSVYRYFWYNTKPGSSNPVTTAPKITTPTSNQVFTDINSTVTGRWSSVNNAQKYQLELYKDSNLVWNGETANTYYSVNLKTASYLTTLNGNYHGRVRAVFSGNTYSNWSDYRYFSISIGTSTTGVPVISEPYEGQNIGDSITHFDWSDVTSATGYELNIQRWNETEFSWYQFNTWTVTGRSWEETYSNPVTTGQFRVRVRAVFTGSVYGEWSGWRNYTNNNGGSNSLTAPVIIAPSAGQNFSSNYVTASWNAVSGAVSYEVSTNYESYGSWYAEGSYTGITSLSKTFSSLPINEYRMKIRAKFSNGSYTNWSDWRYFNITNGSNSSVGTPTLSTPADESHITNNYLILDWSTVTGATSYEYQVTRYANNSTWVDVTSGTVTASEKSVTLSSGLYGQYSFRVRAIKNGIYGNWSAYNQFYYENGSSNLAKPAITFPASNGQTFHAEMLMIKWTASPPTTQYELQKYNLSSGNWELKESGTYDINSSPITQYELSVATYGEGQYRFRARMKLHPTTNFSEWSDWRDFYLYNPTITTAPTINQPVENQVVSGNNVYFTWNNISGVSQYVVMVTPNEFTTQTGSGYAYYSTNQNSYTFVPTGNVHMYMAKVCLMFGPNQYGACSPIRQFEINTDSYVGTPSLIAPAVGAHVTTNNVYLDWLTISDATSYEYQVVRNTGSDWATVANSTVTASNANVYLTSGVYGPYEFRVRAIKNGIYGNWSAYNQFYYDSGSQTNTTKPVIQTPSQNSTVENTTRAVSINWSGVSGAYEYEIQVGPESAGMSFFTTANTTYTYTVPTDNVWYRLYVRAHLSDGGYTDWSTERNFYYDYAGSTGSDYGAPIVTSPSANQVVYSNLVNAIWNPVSSAVSYEVNVSYKSGSSWMEEGTYTVTSANRTLYLNYTNNYRLRVRAKFSDSTYTDWSGWREFKVQL